MEIKIMEWNINQRLNYAKRDIPKWIADIILENSADLIALTEVYKGNNWEDIKNAAFASNYAVFETNNAQVCQNDIVVAVNTNKLDVVYTKAYFPYKEGIPDYLEIKCKSKKTGKKFIFVCVRIHASVSDEVKINELSHVLESLINDDTVIICGDFNNNRRGFKESGRWHLLKIDEMIKQYNFERKTPEGSSIFKESQGNLEYEFADDHFLLKGIDENDFNLMPYDRSFVRKDKIYKWGSDFQVYLGKDINGKCIYESIPAPFPDHAILKSVVEID